jgi:putative radical SAM enzyme (TIGR03279 family)
VNSTTDTLPQIAAIDRSSAAFRVGLMVGDRVLSVNGVVPRDILEWQRLVESDEVDISVLRGRETLDFDLARQPGEPLGVSISSAVFDRIHTCDNHCEFCFIYQLPKGMRRSLYMKDDDYRLSFLFGNFTTMTRFTEADLERVIDEKLSPLYVSIHSPEPHVRSDMLRNVRGGFSLRWMKVLLDNDIEIRAQIVLCPGVNDSEVLESTLAGLLEQYPTLESIAIVPLGLSRFNTEDRMRVHTKAEAEQVIDTVAKWQARYVRAIGRQPIHLADEFYLVAQKTVPESSHYGEFPMLEDGVGLVRSFLDAFAGTGPDLMGKQSGFFASVDVPSPTDYVRVINPAADTGLRSSAPVAVSLRARKANVNKPVAVVTGSYGATVIRTALAEQNFDDVVVLEVQNQYFGGNTAVAGLMTYEDVYRVLTTDNGSHVYLLPDVCLNDGVFLDGGSLEDLQKQFEIEVLPTSGSSLRDRLESAKREVSHV